MEQHLSLGDKLTMENTKPFRDTNYLLNQQGECYRNGKKLKPYPNSKNYLKIDVWTNGKREKQYFLHRMIAEVFIPNPKNHPQVNHIDGDKRNNSVQNLEWCDGSHNIQHAINSLGKMTDMNHGRTKIPATEIKILRWKKSIGYTLNLREIAKKWGLDVKYLGKIINGKQRLRV